MVAVLGPLEALPYYIHILFFIGPKPVKGPTLSYPMDARAHFLKIKAV
jgi:hypothetical protein